MKKNFRTDSVFFLQSLKESDDPTGRKVRDQLAQANDLPFEAFLAFENIFDEEDFKGALKYVLLSIKNEEFKYPAIQIDCHGSQQGLHLRSNDIISWDRIRDFLNQILDLTDDNLLVVFGACFGSFLYQKNEQMNYIPCSVLIASQDELSGDTLVHRFVSFYRALFNTHNIPNAMDQLNHSLYSGHGVFEVMVPSHTAASHKNSQQVGSLNSEKPGASLH